MVQENLNKGKPEINSDLKRIDGHYISGEIEHLLHLDRGFFLTVRELLLRPGKTVREFLFKNRKRLVKPILFLILCSVIFTLIVHYLHLNITLFNIDGGSFKGKIRSKEIGEWTSNNTGYSQLIMGVFIGLWIKIFFRKFKYNIYEILVLLSFIFGQALLILVFFILVSLIFKAEMIFTLGTGVYFLYIIWGIGQFFGERKLINYVKSALTYALGVLSYMLSLTLIAFLLKNFF